MIDNGILKNDSLELEQNLDNYYSDLGTNYELTDNLSNLVNNIDSDYNIRNMIPFYFHFSPIIINHLNHSGIKIINFYFKENCTNETENNSLYFKYPLDIINKGGGDIVQRNNKIYDFIIDPYCVCNKDFDGQKEIIDNIQLNNWFSRCLNDRNTFFKIFKIRKITEEKKRIDYLILYSRSKNITYNNNNNKQDNFFFTFSMKISKDDDKYPFILLDERDNIVNFDYLSIYNLNNKFKEADTSHVEKIYEIDYDIDDNQHFLFKTPKFLSYMNLYSLEEKESETRNNNTSNNEYSLLKYEQMNNVSNYYDINEYFKKDLLIYKFIYFLNQFFLFKKNHPEYLTHEYDNSVELNDDHPCYHYNISDSEEYYESIKEDYGYDCLKDYCFYNDCDQTNTDKQDPKNLTFMPYCYCIPLFCRDNKSPETKFHKKINEYYSNQFYDFTSLKKKEYKFSKIDEYFDRNNFIFKCKIQFNQKNETNNNDFNVKIKIQNLTYQNGDNTFLMFFMNNNNTIYLIKEFLNSNYFWLNIVLLVYIVIVLCCMFALHLHMGYDVDNLIKRMEKIKKIRKTIISNKSDNYNSEIERNSSNDSITNTNTNDDFNNISNDSDDNNKKNKKEKNKSVGELDELDTLISLIDENVDVFQIKFNLNDDMNTTINEIKNQYNGIIKVNQYKNKLLLKTISYHGDNSIDEEEEISNNSKSSFEEKEENFNELSLKMFYELLSTSTSELDFSNIKTNFYYRDYDGKILFGLEDILTCFNNEDSNGNGEITNLSKIKNAIKYYYINIHSYWKEQYDISKNEDNM